MKTSIMLYQADNRKNKETSEKKHGSKLLKFIMLIVVLFSITILSSCFTRKNQTAQVKPLFKIETHDNHNNHPGKYDMGLNLGHRYND